ncbi:MAG TPA: hypothetical protein VMM38_07430 [Aridibacter sp.]|nr:hypothetical protein [Aridibacter sp.]
MSEAPHISEVVPFPDFENIERSGKVVHFTKDRYQAFPQTVHCPEIAGSIRQRYTSFGLIDNVVLDVSHISSFWLGQWMIGCVFSDQFSSYSIISEKEKGTLRELRVDLPQTWNLKDALVEFVWNPKNSEEFLIESRRLNDALMEFHVTNATDEWITIEEFNDRNVLAFSGGIRGIVRTGEFMLNFGANKEEINYDVLHHIAEPPFIADEGSCELRVEGIWVWGEDGLPNGGRI